LSLGAMPYNCGDCSGASRSVTRQIRKERGCTKPSRAVVWRDEAREWYSCPMKFVHSFLYDWVEQYHFLKTFGGAKYETLPAKWFEAMQVYESAIRKYTPKHGQRTGGSLGDLKAALNGN